VVSKVFNRLTSRLLVLATLALVAGGGAASSSAAAPAGRQTAGDTHASSTLTVRNTRYGRVLFDGRGRALYAFTRDRRGGSSQCNGACAKAWPVYFAKGRPRVGAGASQSLVGTTQRRDGRRQITYNGRPLYYYVGDKSPGQILCQNVNEFGGTWLVVQPNGQLVR
jgi:predicted lipoprotein with Yx(FWY)xxD motif